MRHCSNTGVEQTLNNSQHKKLTLEKKILPRELSHSCETTYSMCLLFLCVVFFLSTSAFVFLSISSISKHKKTISRIDCQSLYISSLEISRELPGCGGQFKILHDNL